MTWPLDPNRQVGDDGHVTDTNDIISQIRAHDTALVAPTRAAQLAPVIVRERVGAETTDTAAFNEALASAGALAAAYGVAEVRWLPGRAIVTSGGHARPAGVSVDFANNQVTHTGNNVFLDCHAPGPALDWKKGIGVSRLVLTGNAGANAVGLELGNSYGFHLRDIFINGYANGVAIDFRNRANWCEGTTSQGVLLNFNKVGIRFAGGDGIGGDGGTNSFGYTRLREVSINVAAGGIGILIGPAGVGTETYLYNASIECTLWLSTAGSTGIVAGTQANVVNLKMEVYCEGSPTEKLFQNLGGNFYASGRVYMTGGMTSDVSLGNNLSNPEPTIQNALFPPGTDATNAGVLSLIAGGSNAGSLGTGKANNLAFAFASGYDFTGADVFRIYSVPFSGTGNSVIGNSRRQFSFDGQGIITMIAGTTPANRLSIVPRVGTPESVNGQGPGSLALRHDGHAAGYNTVYIKTTARNTTTGWKPIQPIVTGTTANRPASPQLGWQYFDTTLNKPIWYGNAGWVDATGTAV